MIETACSIAKKTHSKGVLMYADMIEDYESLAKMGQEKKVDLILVVKEEASFQEAQSSFKKVLQIPNISLGRFNQIKMAIIQALSRGFVQKGEKWVCLSGMPQSKALDSLLILEFGKEFEMLFSSDLPVISEIVKPEVFETLLKLALEISMEGKEGRKPTGAIFVLGRHEEVLKYSHPMVINPFQGYPEEDRNILDQSTERDRKGILLHRRGLHHPGGRRHSGSGSPPGRLGREYRNPFGPGQPTPGRCRNHQLNGCPGHCDFRGNRRGAHLPSREDLYGD